MSESDGGPGRREVAYRLFAAEFDDADLEYSESDEERAPNYVVTPTGARVNRLFAVGVLTEVESVSDDVLRARVVDPTGAFVCYAGQYQQDERAFLDRAEPPTFVAVTGKARTFQPDDSDRVFTSVRPESISEVDADTRDRWTVDAAEQTVDRVEALATALALEASGDRLRDALEARGIEEGPADGIALAIDHYGTTPTYLAAVRDLALDAARLVAGEIEEVAGLTASPADAGDVTVTDLLPEPVEPLEAADASADREEAAPSTEPAEEPAEEPGPATSSSAETTEDEAAVEPESEAEPEAETATATAGASTGEGVTDDAESTGETADAAPTEADEDTEGPGDFESGDFDLDEEEREEIEEEYGTEFQTGTEVEEPGEADIETPEPETEAETESEPEAESESEPDAAAEPVAETEPEVETEPEGEAEVEPADEAPDDEASADAPADDEAGGDEEAEPPEAADLVDAVVGAMEELDEGDGAGRSDVIESVTDRTGADPEAVEDAIQDALMDGRCYEPDDATLKPI